MPRFIRDSYWISGFALLLAAGASARAQSIVASPSSLSFMAQAFGSPTAAQTVTISSSGAGFAFTAAASPNAPWLNVTTIAGTGSISVAVNPALLQTGTYSGSVVVTASGATNSPLMIPVTVTAAILQASVAPASLTFVSQSGAAPPAQSIRLSTNLGTPSSFIVTPQSTGNWLSVDRTSGSTPQDILVSVNPGSLSSGTYNGTLLITVPGALGSPINFPVTLTVVSAPQLTVSAAALTFSFQVGQGLPGTQQFTVNAGGTSVNYSVTPTTASGGNWLVVNSSTGTTPGIVNVGVNPAGLTVGTYNGTLTVSSPGASNSPVIPITLTVSLNPLVNASPSAVAFNFTTGGPAVAAQSVTLTSTSAQIVFTAAVSTVSGGPWLQVAPASGSTPGTLTISADPTGLAMGNYAGAVTLTLTGAGAGTLTIPVTFSVNTTAALTANPTAVSFVFQTGTASPLPQAIAVGSTSGILTFATTTSITTGGTWLSASGTGTTPGQVTVTANPAGLAPGAYSGLISIAAAGAGNSPVQIPATLTVSNSPLLIVTPSTLSFNALPGFAAPASQSVAVASTTSGIGFTVATSTTDGANWLLVTQASGTTPGSLTVSANPAGLRSGNYTGTITISSGAAGNTPQVVTVALTVSSAAVTVSPAALTFNQVASGPAPAAQFLQLINTGTPVSFSAIAVTATGGNWLSVTPASGAAPGQVSVSVNGAGLAQGFYLGSITISPAGGAAQTVPVTLVIGAQQTLSATPAALAFSFQSGAPVPVGQTISLSGTTALPFTATAASAVGNWLAVTPAGGTTPASVTVNVNPMGLAGGTYSGTITIASLGASNSPQVIPVTLNVTIIPAPTLSAIVNAASFLNGPVAPGEIVTLGGTGIGPATLTGLQLTSLGIVDTTVANTRVLFDGVAAPIVYASATQTSVVVPYEMAGRVTAQVQAFYQGVPSNLLPVTLTSSAPGIFATNSAGSGQGAILNQNGSVNSASNPSTVGQVVVIFATGEGVTNPPQSTGAVTGSVLPKPVLPVTVTIGGQPAQVNYVGAAPGLIAGVLQVNTVVPAGAGTGNVPVEIKVGANASQANITVALQ